MTALKLYGDNLIKKTGYAMRLSAKQFKGILLKHQSIAAHIQLCPQNLLKYSCLR